MLVGFLGSPCSGKTTTAARLFAELKDSGMAAEFVCEEARRYIAELRVHEQSITLHNHDQAQIMRKQFASESLMSRACGPDVVVVSDSSPLNSLMYMSTGYRHTPFIQEVIQKVQYDVVFLCDPVPPPLVRDPNRIHSFEEAVKLHQDLVENVLPGYGAHLKPVRLQGETRYRLPAALDAINRVLHRCS